MEPLLRWKATDDIAQCLQLDGRGFLMRFDHARAMVFVDGDASMNSYQDANGQPRSSLSVVQSKSRRRLDRQCCASSDQVLCHREH